MSYPTVWQVNVAPDSALAQEALRAAQAYCANSGAPPLAVFFYFDGVGHAHPDCAASPAWQALAHEQGVVLNLCRSAWQRRFDGLPQAQFRLGSLTDLALWLEQAQSYRCFGGGAE